MRHIDGQSATNPERVHQASAGRRFMVIAGIHFSLRAPHPRTDHMQHENPSVAYRKSCWGGIVAIPKQLEESGACWLPRPASRPRICNRLICPAPGTSFRSLRNRARNQALLSNASFACQGTCAWPSVDCRLDSRMACLPASANRTRAWWPRTEVRGSRHRGPTRGYANAHSHRPRAYWRARPLHGRAIRRRYGCRGTGAPAR